MRSKFFLFFFLALVFCHSLVFADASSTNYALSEERFTGGGGSASSTTYQLAETAIGTFSGSDTTSTNYAASPKIGIAGSPIASINSISPATLSKHYSDESATFTVTAVDPDSDALEYRAKQDATVKDGPQASNELTWALSASDLGRHTMNFEVLDPDGTVLKQQAAYVYRRPTK